ncbi:hypothetical protein EVJ50_11755 [Synechococcus sp. RSCCF101]|uniref:hypothetical protein n=1 Tax=Synechococcus sp. RSCCF101 TaxID=2511069 RepID=UPI001245D23C|nr:hypothetical protein [Synechococcus sp. RSCCF101]QEY32805.1 hypothetical protein EVJ50_11755 [Synechococcus sp. RSCCF101]
MFSGLTAGITERLAGLRAWLIPQIVYLAISDECLLLMRVERGSEGPASRFWSLPIPKGACKEGVPMQKEALGDLLSDWLLDQSVVGGILSVVLAENSCRWRLLEWGEGGVPEDPIDDLRERMADLPLPDPIETVYIAAEDVEPASASAAPCSLMVSAPRDLVTAWVEVANFADLPLRRVESPQMCQWRAVFTALDETADVRPSALLALLVPEGRDHRLTLFQRRLPEFEQVITGYDADAAGERLTFVDDLEERVRRFQRYRRLSPDTTWCLVGTLAEDEALQDELRQRHPDWSVWPWTPERDWPGLLAEGMADPEEDEDRVESHEAIPDPAWKHPEQAPLLLRLAGLMAKEARP